MYSDNFRCDIWGSYSDVGEFSSILTYDAASIRFEWVCWHHVQDVSGPRRVDLDNSNYKGRGGNLPQNVHKYLPTSTDLYHTRHGSPIFSKFFYVSALGKDRVVADLARKVLDMHVCTTCQQKIHFCTIKMKAGVLAIYPGCCCLSITDTILVHKSCCFKGTRCNCQI
jgi:hypothetical protein